MTVETEYQSQFKDYSKKPKKPRPIDEFPAGLSQKPQKLEYQSEYSREYSLEKLLSLKSLAEKKPKSSRNEIRADSTITCEKALTESPKAPTTQESVQISSKTPTETAKVPKTLENEQISIVQETSPEKSNNIISQPPASLEKEITPNQRLGATTESLEKPKTVSIQESADEPKIGTEPAKTDKSSSAAIRHTAKGKKKLKKPELAQYGSGNTHPSVPEHYMKTFNTNVPLDQQYPNTISRGVRIKEFDRDTLNYQPPTNPATLPDPKLILKKYKEAQDLVKKIQLSFRTEYQSNYLDWSQPIDKLKSSSVPKKQSKKAPQRKEFIREPVDFTKVQSIYQMLQGQPAAGLSTKEFDTNVDEFKS